MEKKKEKAAGVNWEEQQRARKWVPLIPAIGLLLRLRARGKKVNGRSKGSSPPQWAMDAAQMLY